MAESVMYRSLYIFHPRLWSMVLEKKTQKGVSCMQTGICRGSLVQTRLYRTWEFEFFSLCFLEFCCKMWVLLWTRVRVVWRKGKFWIAFFWGIDIAIPFWNNMMVMHVQKYLNYIFTWCLLNCFLKALLEKWKEFSTFDKKKKTKYDDRRGK